MPEAKTADSSPPGVTAKPPEAAELCVRRAEEAARVPGRHVRGRGHSPAWRHGGGGAAHDEQTPAAPVTPPGTSTASTLETRASRREPFGDDILCMFHDFFLGNCTRTHYASCFFSSLAFWVSACVGFLKLFSL